MARILGVHVRVAEGRYVAGFAALEGTTVVDSLAFRAPAEEERQFSELYGRTLELVRAHDPMEVALQRNESHRSPRAFRVACRAEGVVLAAAGQLNKRVRPWAGTALLKQAGLTGTSGVTVRAAIEELNRQIAFHPRDPAEANAAAAALASSRGLGLS